MSLRKRTKLEFPQVVSTYNQTNPLNPSHFVDANTDFFLRPITLENIDQAVFEALHRKFTVAQKPLNLIPLDAELASMRFQNPQSFDTLKQYLNLPYFTMWRTQMQQIVRSSNTNRPTIYVVPTHKPQGTVYTEYIMPPPPMIKLSYTFKFVTTYREYLNELEQQFLEYFKNKRNVIVMDNERFEIMPNEQFILGALDTVDREGATGQTLYVVTYELQVIAYTRDITQILKRERPNLLNVRLSERSGEQLDTLSQTVTRLPTTGIDDKIL
jgi:hypothetical protein